MDYLREAKKRTGLPDGRSARLSLSVCQISREKMSILIDPNSLYSSLVWQPFKGLMDLIEACYCIMSVRLREDGTGILPSVFGRKCSFPVTQADSGLPVVPAACKKIHFKRVRPTSERSPKCK
jgi:hypothetical protein